MEQEVLVDKKSKTKTKRGELRVLCSPAVARLVFLLVLLNCSHAVFYLPGPASASLLTLRSAFLGPVSKDSRRRARRLRAS